MFCYFFLNILDQVRMEQNSGLKFVSLFLSLSHPGLDRNNEGMMFFNFFCCFFFEFSCAGRVGTEFGTKFFFFSLGLSHPDLDRRNEWMVFFNFMNFFAIFFGIFLHGSCRNEFGTKFFSLSFSSYLTPVWIEIMLEWCFLVFSFFLPFFLED